MTEVLAPTPEGIARAAALLREGLPVAVPTETVYGLAARADSAEAVAAIYRAKGRPSFNPLIVHAADVAAAHALAHFDERADQLAEAYWPGPLTMVLPMRADSGLAPAVTAGLGTVGIRVPAHPVMHALLAATGLPLAAPSANRSLAVSPTTAEHVLASLGEGVAAVLDGGPCERGLESTIVALRENGGWNLLREGPLSRDVLTARLGAEAQANNRGIEAPGQMARHYAPGKPLRLCAEKPAADEFMIGFGAVGGDCTLSATGDLAEAAARLYAALHQAAAARHPRIAVAAIPEVGIGAAINDRLRRAAA